MAAWARRTCHRCALHWKLSVTRSRSTPVFSDMCAVPQTLVKFVWIRDSSIFWVSLPCPLVASLGEPHPMFRVSCKEMGHFPMEPWLYEDVAWTTARISDVDLVELWIRFHGSFQKCDNEIMNEFAWNNDNLMDFAFAFSIYVFLCPRPEEWFYSPLFDMAHMRSLLVRHLCVECHFLGRRTLMH